MSRSKTLLTVIENEKILKTAVNYLKRLCKETGESHQGIYFVSNLSDFGRLGREIDDDQHKEYLEKKIGKS